MSDALLSDTQQATIREAVEQLQPEIVAALQELVRIPSQTGDEGVAQEAVAALMRRHELDVDVWEPEVAELAPYAEHVTLGGGFAGRPNVVGALRSGGNGRSLILNGHIDTVEVGNRAAWSVDPFGGSMKNGRLYGRGACDMKGGIVANLFALRAVRLAGFQPSGDVFVQSTISEEDGGAGALAAMLRGYVADAAVISEPTQLAIVTAQGGSLMFRLHVPGLSAHACVRDEGVSAIENFAYLHRGLLAFESRRNDEIDDPRYAEIGNKVPINIGTIRGGAWPSSVPDNLEAEGRAGLVPGEDLESFKDRLAQQLSALAGAHSWLRDHPPTIEWLDGQFAPAGVPKTAPLVTCLASAADMALSRPARVEGVTYGADMRHFVNTGGMPCVMFGAGDVRLAHAPDESIPVAELFQAIIASAFFIASWCGVSPA
jgi:acetylornithine deacetylase